MKQKICKECGSTECIKHRRYCLSCYKKYQQLKAKRYYPIMKAKRQASTSICKICGNSFCNHGRKDRTVCKDCYMQSKQTGYIPHNYKMIGAKPEHRVIAETILGRTLTYQEVVHHIDENPRNNNLDNLIILSRSDHAKLHIFLRIQRVAYEKSIGKHSANCWNSLRVSQTTTWLETTSVKVIKLWELANQQPRSV